jgi:nitrite reductase/ring-hydroxylating ferredoxin subunit
MDADEVAAADAVPADGTLLFTAREGFDLVEVVLCRVESEDGDADVAAYRNHCQHWTDVRLDTGDGAPVRDGSLLCARHGATFRIDDGRCTHGPCEGAVLDTDDEAVADGTVYLTDDDLSFERLGPSGDRDLSTGSRIGFGG